MKKGIFPLFVLPFVLNFPWMLSAFTKTWPLCRVALWHILNCMENTFLARGKPGTGKALLHITRGLFPPQHYPSPAALRATASRHNPQAAGDARGAQSSGGAAHRHHLPLAIASRALSCPPHSPQALSTAASICTASLQRVQIAARSPQIPFGISPITLSPSICFGLIGLKIG